MQSSDVDELTDAVLAASRVLVSISARSIAGADPDLTMPQFRTLVVLARRGPQSLHALADELQVVPSTATRMCDRLVRKGLIDRTSVEGNRREVELSLTADGKALVAGVMRRRRTQIRRIVESMAPDQRAVLAPAVADFARAAGDPPEDPWFLGWS